MEIKKHKDSFSSFGDSTWIILSEKEALNLISSLALQIANKDPNSKRLEFTVDGGYTTIAVDFML